MAPARGSARGVLAALFSCLAHFLFTRLVQWPMRAFLLLLPLPLLHANPVAPPMTPTPVCALCRLNNGRIQREGVRHIVGRPSRRGWHAVSKGTSPAASRPGPLQDRSGHAYCTRHCGRAHVEQPVCGSRVRSSGPHQGWGWTRWSLAQRRQRVDYIRGEETLRGKARKTRQSDTIRVRA